MDEQPASGLWSPCVDVSFQLEPKGDADINKVLFAQFKWVTPVDPTAKKK